MNFGTAPKHSNRSVVTFVWWLLSRCMLALSVLSIALYRNASHHEHPCTAVVLTLAWHPFIRVGTVSEAVYKLVAEPISEPQAGESQAEAAAEPEDGVTVDAPRRWMDRPDMHYAKENVRQASII